MQSIHRQYNIKLTKVQECKADIFDRGAGIHRQYNIKLTKVQECKADIFDRVAGPAAGMQREPQGEMPGRGIY